MEISRHGSHVGSHFLWIPTDTHGRRWARMAVAPAHVELCGHPRTPLGDLRIRRLRVQVLPSALPKPLREQGFSASQEAGLLWEGSDVLCEFRLGQGVWGGRMREQTTIPDVRETAN